MSNGPWQAAAVSQVDDVEGGNVAPHSLPASDGSVATSGFADDNRLDRPSSRGEETSSSQSKVTELVHAFEEKRLRYACQ